MGPALIPFRFQGMTLITILNRYCAIQTYPLVSIKQLRRWFEFIVYKNFKAKIFHRKYIQKIFLNHSMITKLNLLYDSNELE